MRTHTRRNGNQGDEVLVAPIEHLAREGAPTIAARVRERPWAYAGIAAGCGFVLGGGLATPLAMKLLRRATSFALQVAVAPVLLARLEDSLGRWTGLESSGRSSGADKPPDKGQHKEAKDKDQRDDEPRVKQQ